AAVEIRGTAPAERDLAAVLLGEGDVAFAAVALRRADDRTHQRRRIGRRTDLDVAVGRADRLHDVVFALLRYEHARRRDARLARRHRDDCHGAGRGAVDGIG